MLVVEIGSSLVKNDIRYDVTIVFCWNNQHLSDGSDQRPKNISLMSFLTKEEPISTTNIHKNQHLFVLKQ
jgi:hypothetical protein